MGGVYAALARERGARRIALGRDGRLTSPELEAALLEGLLAGGLDVLRLGIVPTPQVTFAVRSLGLDGGVMVTASHNPPGDNGFKLLVGEERVHGTALQALVAREPLRGGAGAVEDADVTDTYLDALRDAAGPLRPLRVAWDCGSGATGPLVERLSRRLAGEHVLLNTTVDGRFPAHHPDPAEDANLRQLQAVVVRHACDLGIAFDGDGDRIGVIDGTGAVIAADRLLLFLARDLLRDRPGAAVVADVKSSSVLFEGVRAAGGRPTMVPSGYVLVRQAMLAEGALLGGELSGHIFYADGWDGTDDGPYVAARLLRALARSRESLAEFRASLPVMAATPEMRIPCPDERKAAVVAEVADRLAASGADVSRADGLRVSTPDGWWLLRASGTEPKITCRCEAWDEDGLERLMSQLRAQLRASGVSI